MWIQLQEPQQRPLLVRHSPHATRDNLFSMKRQNCCFPRSTIVVWQHTHARGDAYPYTCSKYDLLVDTVIADGSVGIDIQHHHLLISSMGTRKIYASNTIAASIPASDFYTIATMPTGVVYACSLFTTDTHVYCGGYSPTFGVFSIAW